MEDDIIAIGSKGEIGSMKIGEWKIKETGKIIVSI
jgi:hypothetical protein